MVLLQDKSLKFIALLPELLMGRAHGIFRMFSNMGQARSIDHVSSTIPWSLLPVLCTGRPLASHGAALFASPSALPWCSPPSRCCSGPLSAGVSV